MNQGGKGAASEPPRVENKRDRRRGAAGRAAALRRAPSDSDCSGETASLSADSGDRAPRPTPLAPPRSGKTRSRRRGSEWEVLEGLKDGQRFEKRPDVFNGYLHKKRKWPLKGWHKRFFVVDGGILVYARSPTDVARGRLHGSVDVGLSVISAKARRRRIDIDADEFIYHLRAKTPEVFRTWLNVLKAHRLYRQHLLTFGARESVPKIHAPLDDLPVTDNSSHVSYYSEDSSDVSHSPSSKPSSPIPLSSFDSKLSDYVNKDHTSIYIWQQDIPSTGGLIPLNFENFDNNGDQNTDNTYDLKFDEKIYNQSMCSMKCIANRYVDIFKQHNNKSPISLNTTDMEKQITCTDLNTDSPKIIAQSPVARISKQVDLLKNNILVNQVIDKVESKKDINDHKVLTGKRTPFSHKSKRPTTTTCYFFSKKKHIEVNNSIMKKSKKCTNLVKYKNAYEEPPLKAEASKCMLLGKFKVFAKEIEHKAVKNRADSIGTQQRFREVACNVAVEKASDKVQVDVFKENKSSQSISDPNDVDKITEQLMVKIFHRCSSSKVRDVKFYVEQVIQDLYDVKLNQDIHPVKALFRNLLDYWLKNTNISRFKEGMTSDKSIGQSQNPPTKDANLSTYIVKMKSKDTQIHYVHNKCKTTDAATVTVNANFNSAHTTRHKVREIREIKYETEAKKNFTPRLDQTLRQSASFEKERHIQELERLLKSTVYMCEMDCKHNNKEKDIVITKKLIDNIGLHSEHKIHDIKSDEKPPIKNSSSSGEIPEIQDTIDRLIDDAAISPDIAKEFLGAYLDVLLQNSSRSTNSSFSSGYNKDSNEAVWCEVVGEAVIKKISKSISTIKVLNKKSHLDKPKPVTDKEKQIDPGQVYLKNMLEKVTSIFSKATNMNKDTLLQTKPNAESLNLKDSVQKTIKDELGRPVIKSKYDFIYENCEQNSLVIDLSKYYLEHISMLNDPAVKEVMSITIKLKEKQPSHGKENSTCLNFKFPDNTKPIKATNIENCENWVPLMTHNTPANNMSHKGDAQKITCNFGSKVHNIDPANFFSNISECSSKPNLILHDNDNFFDLPNSTETDFCKELLEDNITAAELHPCYIMSIKKGVQFQGKKNVNTKNEECNSPILDDKYPSASPAIDMAELSIFERPTPRVIDEKFLLLLLENLAYVSKTVVSMHKDINALYLKLKKRHEKGVKTMINLQGLSLLGKIYSEDACCKDDNDKTTQCEFIHDKTETRFETRNASTNTNINKIGEKSACSCTHTPIFKIVGLQTGANNYMGNRSLSEIHSKSSNKPIMAVTETNTADIKTAQQSTSIPDCFNALTVETAVNTAITTTFIKLPNKNSFPSKFHKDTTKKKRASYKVGEDFLKEISISPLNKVSNHSQTEKRLAFDKWQRNVKDYNMCQLFVGKKCGIKTSSSFSSSTAEVEMSDEIKTLYRCPSDPSFCSGLISPSTPTIRGPQAGFVSGTPGGRFQGWIIESGGPLESAGRELGQAQLSVQQLQRLLDALDMQHQHHHDTDVSLEGASPNVKKDRRKFALRKKKSNNKCASVELQAPHMDPSSSHTALSSLSALTAPPSPGGGACSASNSAASLPIACAAARPQSLPGAETLSTAQGPASISSLTPDHQLREDFTVLAKDLVASLKGVVSSLICERGRLRAALEAAEAAATPGGVAMAALRTNLTSALQQNSELRTRLSRIHDASDIAEIISVGNSETVTRQFQQSLSYSSSCVSASEFFDAEEHEDDDLKPDDVIPTDEAGVIELDGDSSSEAGSLSSEEGSASSDNSDGAMLSAEQVTLRHSAAGGRPASCWSRRTRLPAPRPSPGGPSLWNLLYKNIGKDLSQISMPVTINEPLNMLQRLCEELEYSELLDSAAACTNAIERCALIASFAVSAYAASAHRAASKPFNPLLAETYECVRDDRAFRFLAEQVSHHPPISACHAESPRWCFWQEARIKTKFWGKSMEFQPTGRVHVRLLTTGDHYTWNKVTTCVHNLFGGQRWVDQYGEMQIACLGTDIACKLNFVKASSWSHTRHEVRGAVTAGSAGARLRLAGRWSEALYAGEPPAARCLWRPGAMPPEHELYYGFTRFAMELNEIEPGMRDLLPHTDTRLRPDQRALEEGDVDSAESYKLSLEQAQRERRRESLQHQPAWFRKAVEDGEETWIFTGEYWKAREAGFSEHSAPRIW